MLRFVIYKNLINVYRFGISTLSSLIVSISKKFDEMKSFQQAYIAFKITYKDFFY